MWAREPYRLFFPLGIIASVIGVSLWGLLHGGMLPWYPGEAHARLMVEGFMGAFIIGFLGTAFPRLVGTPPCTKAEVSLLAGLWVIAVACHATNRIAAGDVWFALTLVALIHSLGARWIFLSKDVPPPGFPLAVIGIAGGAAGAILLACGSLTILSSFTTNFARLLLYQGLPILPILGIAPFLWPRFFGRPSPHNFDESPTLPPGWKNQAATAAIIGLAMIATWAWEADGHVAQAHGARALVILIWAGIATPVLRAASRPGTAANALRWAVLSMIGGCVLAALYPGARIGSIHFVLVSGIGLITLVVASRVVLGHAGQLQQITGKLVWLRWITGLLLFAAATRAVVDFVPKVKVSHHIYALSMWIVVALIWMWRMRASWNRADEED